MTHAALFDMDGTLVDTEARSRAAWTLLFEAHGVPYDESLLLTFSGRRGQEVLGEHLHLFPGGTVEELYAEAVSYYSSPALPPIAPVPGAVELVRLLHSEGVRMAVVSSGRRRDIEPTLHQLAMHDMFELIVAAEDVRHGKPHPEGYLSASRRLDVPPSQAVVFEDSPAGVTAAKAAGARCIGVATSQPPQALLHADYTVTDLTEVSWPLMFPA
ncbi:HAD family hydrolase [Streptomyces fumanus]|uniref:Haloacid dehalogenase n=1 Tax=Streptomyces fumanus TaxID=67302 RepID=A0A919A9X7_9ACTN|nr:HAD family phosphatase [Streptomyces fumanus]GHE93956.1 haloacid dehalogenase [Streptomyces fumanus]